MQLEEMCGSFLVGLEDSLFIAVQHAPVPDVAPQKKAMYIGISEC